MSSTFRSPLPDNSSPPDNSPLRDSSQLPDQPEFDTATTPLDLDELRRRSEEDPENRNAPGGLTLAIAVERLRHRLIHQLDDDLIELGVSFAAMRALLVFEEARSRLHAGELGRRLRISRQAAHTLMRRLDRLGLLDIEDEGWAKSAVLTKNGHRYARFCLDATAGTLARFETLSPVDRRRLRRILQEADHELFRPPPRRPWWWE